MWESSAASFAGCLGVSSIRSSDENSLYCSCLDDVLLPVIGKAKTLLANAKSRRDVVKFMVVNTKKNEETVWN